MFSAILIDKAETGQTVALAQIEEDRLPEGDVTIDVAFSTLNYKDGLAITGKSPVVRKFPMVPGIDLAGTVTESSDADWKIGDTVVLNGWGVGESHWGGLAQRARLKGDWLVPLPAAFTPRQAMAIGTAGYTASLCVEALLRHGVVPGSGEVLVTGATGGVGSVAIALLVKAGFKVTAATGKAAEASISNISVQRRSLTATSSRPPASRCRKSVGRRWWIPSAATRWPMRARRLVTVVRSPPAAWRKAWISRHPSLPSSCAAWLCLASTA